MTTNQKIKRFTETVQSLFPGLNTSHLSYGNTVKEKAVWNHFHFNIPPQNSSLINSPYFYNRKSVVHFTSIPALSSILKENVIRLYNLHTLNDPREFTFASKIFKLNKTIIDDAKDNLFLMSFCERGILKKSSEEFNMWRLYGLQGKGVAIVFSIANNPAEWSDFHFSKVIYGSVNRGNFGELFKILEELNQDRPTIDIDFGKLYAFHKSKLFQPETEVRLLFDRRMKRAGMGGRTVTRKDKLLFPIIKSDLFKLIESKDKIRYLQIPIHSKDIKESDAETPILKIDEIIIGYNFEKEAQQIIEIIEQLCLDTIGYKPKVKQTRLSKFYWDIDNSSEIKSK